ncbi:protocadherin Fat 4 [Patella vulgata]|uniref:protocadherin Fat 4 n=1 Tax=Patella vulgata TaxID=6465 RepID=UPI0024AA0134|nr:protocadherin Fat 4 [Patella vulgata]
MENRSYTGFCITENTVCTPGNDGTGYCQCKSNYVEATISGSYNIYCTEAPETLSFEKRYQWEVNDVKTEEPQTFDIEIKINPKFKREHNSVDIVPRSNQISSTINDTTLTFTINSANLLEELQKYLVEVSISFSGKHVVRDSFLLDLTLKSNATNNNTMNVTVPENAAINTTVVSLSYLPGYKDFQFVDCSNAFRIEKDLYVKTKVELDREVKDNYQCDIKAVLINNETSCVLRNVGTLVIEILDKNDEPPVFTQQKYTGEITENSPINTNVSFNKIPIISDDKDISPNNNVTYTLDGTGSSLFKLEKVANTREVRISSVEKLDRETKSSYSFTISAFDGNQTSIVELNIAVLDVNEPPIFIQESYNFTVLEYSVGQFVGSVSAIDNDSGERGVVIYRLQKDFGLFRIDNNGSIFLINSIQKRDEECCELEIYATDDDNSPVKAFVKANVTIEDKNEPPQFNKPVYSFYINENNESNATIGTVMATDNDFYDNAKLKFSISGNIDDIFHIDTNSGKISCRNSFDYEKTQVFYFTVIVEDSGHPPLNSTADVTVHVQDVNDNSPKPDAIFYKTTVSLRKESNNIGKPIIVIEATDEDSGQNGEIFYKIVEESNMDGLFNISKSSGLVTIAKNTTNYKSFYFLNISISDMGNPPRSTNIDLNVTVDEVSGALSLSLRFNTTEISYTVQEEDKNPHDLWHIGEFVKKDENKDISYKFVGDSQSGHNVSIYKNGTLNNKHTFDREKKDLYQLIIQVYDTNDSSISDIVLVNIIIVDINDNAPRFQLSKFHFDSDENVKDHFVAAVTATDRDIGNNSNIVYSIDNRDVPFTINSTNGRITTSGEIDREMKDFYLLYVEATDGKHVVKVNVTMTINDINDNSPQIHVIEVLNIYENSSLDTKLMDINATDADVNIKIRLSILNQTNSDCPFRLLSGGQGNGEIYLNSVLDYENDKRSYVCTILAVDQPSNKINDSRSTAVDITINVVDVNDNAPVFPNFTSNITIEVDIAIGTVITHLSASDKDSGSNGDITFSVDTENTTPYGYGTFFKIVNNSGISVENSLSSIPSSTVELVVIAKDGGQPSLTSQSTISINISRSEEIPKFTLSKYTLNIIEHDDYIPALTVTANDTKDGVNRECACKYFLQSEYFSIDVNTGQLYLKEVVDREQTGSKFKIEVSAEDDDNPPRTATAEITIYVEDINDNPPVCNQSLFDFNITQSDTTIFGKVVATDQDEGDNAKLYYHNNSSEGVLFTADITTGSLRLSKPFVTTSRITQEYLFDVEVKDTVYATNCKVKVTIFPDNINSPNFTKAEYTAAIPVYGKRGDNLEMSVEIKATDRDNDTITYGIDPNNEQSIFDIDPTSGIISLNSDIDPNTGNTKLRVIVIAIDSGLPPKTGSATVHIAITGLLCVGKTNYDVVKSEADLTGIFRILFIAMVVGLCLFIILFVVTCYKWRTSKRREEAFASELYNLDNTGMNRESDEVPSGNTRNRYESMGTRVNDQYEGTGFQNTGFQSTSVENTGAKPMGLENTRFSDDSEFLNGVEPKPDYPQE